MENEIIEWIKKNYTITRDGECIKVNGAHGGRAINSIWVDGVAKFGINKMIGVRKINALIKQLAV